MDPTITGALIAGGAALVGFGASAWQTRITVRANRRDVRDQLLWAKRTELYESLLEATEAPDLAEHLSIRDWSPRLRTTLEPRQDAVYLYASDVVYAANNRLWKAIVGMRQATTDPPNLSPQEEELAAAVRALKGLIRSEVQG